MRYLVLALATLLLSSCSSISLWPFGDNEAAHCMDDDSCEAAEPIDRALTSGEWYCYGVDRDQPWDCRKSADASAVAAISDQPEQEPVEIAETTQPRAEMNMGGQTISHQQPPQETAAPEAPTAEPEPASPTLASVTNLFDHPDDFYAVQLIALQSLDEIVEFAARHGLSDPNWVQIESQGNTWYVLLLGIYANRAQADIAANSWSDQETPETRPWVRPLGPLKRAVLRAQSGDG